jgi:hypothetical protein
LNLRRTLFLSALLPFLLALAGCGETHTWRQKTILDVETPSGIVSGGSVVEIQVGWFGALDRMLGGGVVSNASRGEASLVELAPSKYLFALTVDEPHARAMEMFRNSRDEDNKVLTARLQNLRDTRSVSPSLYPRLVTFADVNNPKSVKLVDPADLAATFGPGFRLKEIKLELTDEPVTEGAVEAVLRWLEKLNGRYLHGGETSRDAPLGLHGGNFKSGYPR